MRQTAEPANIYRVVGQCQDKLGTLVRLCTVVAGRPARCAIVRDGHPHASLGATSIRAGDWKKCGNAKSGSTAWKTRESIATTKSRNAHVDFLQEICERGAACNVQCNWERCEILSITNYSYWKGITTTINAY